MKRRSAVALTIAIVFTHSTCCAFVLTKGAFATPCRAGTCRAGTRPPGHVETSRSSNLHAGITSRRQIYSLLLSTASSFPGLLPLLSVEDDIKQDPCRYVQCCRACSEWKALDLYLGKLESELATGKLTGQNQQDKIKEALMEAQHKVLRPSLLAAMELYDNRRDTSQTARELQQITDMEACYDAALALWSREGWEQALNLIKTDHMYPTLDTVKKFRTVMRTIVSDVEDSFVGTFAPAKEALPQDDGARYRQQSITVDLSSSSFEGRESEQRRKRDVLYSILKGELSKTQYISNMLREVVSRLVGTLVRDSSSRRSRTRQLAVGMDTQETRPTRGAEGGLVEDRGEDKGGGGEERGQGSTNTQHLFSDLALPSRKELVEDELPEVLSFLALLAQKYKY